ncbi:MAG: Tad domain-containing protein [Anaerolineales bacterium]
MNHRLWRQEHHSRGQVLVWVAVLMVVLLAIAGLAIDGGVGLSQRRQMQNAADAGALAGARELCLGNRAQAQARAVAYAQDNGAQQVQVELRKAPGAGETDKESIVWVQAQQQVETSLLGVIGVHQYPVKATAQAGCMRSPTACGLWPIAFPKSVWDGIPCNTRVYIWDDEKVSYDCQVWQCTAADGSNAVIASSGERGWLDFSGSFDPGYPSTCPSGGGANMIKELIEGDCAGRISLPICIPGEPGKIASVEKPIQSRILAKVALPLFDYVGCADGNHNSYHLSSFGCFEVIGYHKKASIKVREHETDEWTTIETTVIEVKKTCDNCQAKCATVGDEPASGGGDVISIGLIE